MTQTSNSGLIALAAGGTGGHMFPAQALSEELQRRGRRVMLVTDARGARYAENFPCEKRFEISAASSTVGGPLKAASAAFSIAGGVMTAMREFAGSNVAAAVGFGGYPSLPAMQAARLKRIPYGLHEQNGVLGRTNRILAGGAAFLAHAFPILEKAPAGAQGKLVEIGNPVRDAVTLAAKAPFAAPAGGRIELLVFGGSQGAALFSRVVPAAIAQLPEDLRRRLKVTQQAREDEEAEVRATYAQAGVAAELSPFLSDMPSRMAQAHFVISRAGASTLTELSIIGRPALLAPLAIAMDDHQTGNAKVLSEAGGAVLTPEADFTAETVSAALQRILSDDARLAEMAAAAKDRVMTGAAARLADLAEALADGVASKAA